MGTAHGICHKLLCSTTNQKFKIQKLLVGGSTCGTTWNDTLWNVLQNKLSWNVLKELDISTTISNKEENDQQNSYLTDEGFNNLSKSTSLTYLNISGHDKLTGLSITSILNSNPNLQILDISNCTSIVQNIHTFSNALGIHQNLHTLVLQNCFGMNNGYHDSNSTTPPKSYYSLVLSFIQSICKSTYFKHVVKEINFEGCYVIDKHMVQILRTCCNTAISLKLKGTKYYEEEEEELK